MFFGKRNNHQKGIQDILDKIKSLANLLRNILDMFQTDSLLILIHHQIANKLPNMVYILLSY